MKISPITGTELLNHWESHSGVLARIGATRMGRGSQKNWDTSGGFRFRLLRPDSKHFLFVLEAPNSPQLRNLKNQPLTNI